MSQLWIIPILLLVVGLVYLYFSLKFERWKKVFEWRIRENAVKISKAVTIGKVVEHLIPYFPEFPYNPKDARFLGSPIDLIVFDGLDDGDVRRIVFIEVKTGGAVLSWRERKVKDAIQRGSVEWLELRTTSQGADS